MLRTARLTRWLLYSLAVAYSVAAIFYSACWIYTARRQPPVELGFDHTWIPTDHSFRVDTIQPGSPADQSGLRIGDRLRAVNGHAVTDSRFVFREWFRHRPGDHVDLTITRGSGAPQILTGTLRRRVSRHSLGTLSQWVQDAFPIPFIAVGLVTLFLRIDDPIAWLFALLCGAFAATPGFPDGHEALPPALRPFSASFQSLFLSQLGTLFYTFFALFPRRSALDRRLPWLKWLSAAVGFVIALPGPYDGRLRYPTLFARRFHLNDDTLFWFVFLFIIAGLIALAHNFFSAREADVRRKIRVIFWGTLLGIIPALVRSAIQNATGYRATPLLDFAATTILFLLPLSFAYAVVKHRVLEIPILIRRSARYLLVQRGFVVLLFISSIGLTLLFAFSFEDLLRPDSEYAQVSGITLGAVFGTALFWLGSAIHRPIASRIDRAFFRSAYDGRRILEDLASRAPAVTDLSELAALLLHHLTEALHPRALAICLDDGSGTLSRAAGVDVPAPEYVVPIPGHQGRQAGLIALDTRLSDEPYSKEDKRLLDSIATQAATALENFRLARDIAERMEREHRLARELEIAREVQARLLPEELPRLATLACAARCIQARAVGGDYYDFLELDAPHATGLVLADVAGKGVHAALLMANLQAHLRSQAAAHPDDPARVLQTVNHTLWKTTAARHFATLFYGIYDDATRQLRYVNCGHNPPLLLRAHGDVHRLPATATVVGAFPVWNCEIAETVIHPGDLLVIFSDGVTEAARGEAEEFGEERLLAELTAARAESVDAILNRVVSRVLDFSAGTQTDDVTILIARGV